MPDPYPLWKYYPSRSRPPGWVTGIAGAFAASLGQIDTRDPSHGGLASDDVLAVLRPALVALGFEVEAGKKKADKIRRPVLFTELGREDQAYEVDGFHPDQGIALEV